MTENIILSPRVQEAVNNHQPLVALESTIITHGMPYPENRDTALQVEALVSDNGAVPATIAVIDGAVRVGLDESSINSLAQANDVMKLSRADLAFAVSSRCNGSTTVAATMIIAHLAGITVFATGGIGGVHRGAEHTFDISADLHEFARTPVHVVSAGAKAILDTHKTLELLETLGVPVVTLGQQDFPAFWSRDSGLESPLKVNSVKAIADFIKARNCLNIAGGVLIGNPVPQESEIPKAEMDLIIEQAITDSTTQGVSGKSVTPWLLNRIVELTNGRSLVTNQHLILNNAAVAAQLAVALSQ